MPDYLKLIKENKIESSEQIFQLFWNTIAFHWTEEYATAFPKHGEISLQNFEGFSFTIDHIWPDVEAADINHELPETRVISFFGISNTKINKINRSRMKVGWGKTSEAFAQFGINYDKGHFIAHGFGGPIDVNLFPQRRDINRGWSAEGKRYRAMERYIASNPGTVVFSRPLYNDLTVCPYQLEYGYFDKDFNLVLEIFPNR
jgi:hypothetical protein